MSTISQSDKDAIVAYLDLSDRRDDLESQVSAAWRSLTEEQRRLVLLVLRDPSVIDPSLVPGPEAFEQVYRRRQEKKRAAARQAAQTRAARRAQESTGNPGLFDDGPEDELIPF